MPAEVVLLIRHGETDYNRERRLQGMMGVPLNDTGREQARALAAHLRELSLEAVYTSPVSRASETAAIVASALDLPLHEDDRLREIAFGAFEGMTFAEVQRSYPEAARHWESGYLSYRAPGGESREDVSRRMRGAWDEIISGGGKRVAVVSHGSAIMMFLGSLYAVLPGGGISNTSITTLRRRGDIWEIAGFAQVPHLKRASGST